MKTVIRICYGLSMAFWLVVWGGAFGDHPTNPADITFHQVFAWLGLPAIVGMFLLFRYVGSSWEKLGTGKRILVSIPALATPVIFGQAMVEFIGYMILLGLALVVLFVGAPPVIKEIGRQSAEQRRYRAIEDAVEQGVDDALRRRGY